MSKKIKVIIIILLLLVISIATFLFLSIRNKEELQSIKSERELLRIYNGENSEAKEVITNIITMPFSFMNMGYYPKNYIYTDVVSDTDGKISPQSYSLDSVSSAEESSSGSSLKDYSTTNIQVENVDEADITKTDGDYINKCCKSTRHQN